MSNKTLKRGDQWATKGRPWAVVDENGRICIWDGQMAIYSKRRDALKNRQCYGDRVVRLSDLTGVVQ